jgi:hypothetical protein
VVTKLDRLARSVADAHAIVQELTRAQVRLNQGGSLHDPADPVGKLLFTALAMGAEFEADLARLRTREGTKVAKAKGRLRGKQPKLKPASHVVVGEQLLVQPLFAVLQRLAAVVESLFTVVRLLPGRPARFAGRSRRPGSGRQAGAGRWCRSAPSGSAKTGWGTAR